MGKIVGQRTFIRQLRAKGLLARTFDHIRNICGAIANRAMTAGGDSSPGFTIAFRDALQFKTLYSQALIATNTTLTPALVSELKDALHSVAELDEERARTKLSLGGDGTKFSLSIDADYDEYNKPITLEDVETLRSIGRKSINAFTSEDIQKAQKWAYKFYKELGVKSPFFRAWFGDWRANDNQTKVSIVPINPETIERGDVPRGDFINTDTGWSITSNSDGIDETANKEQKRSNSYHALKDINKLLQNAVLLDTIVVTKPSKRIGKNAAFMHHLYCPISIRGQVGLAKLYVAESLGDKQKFYLLRIEKASTAMGFSTEYGESTPHSKAATDDAAISIAQIYDFVKKHNVDFEKNSDHYVPFEPKPVSQLLLNKDGTPKVVYHGSDADFTTFDITKSRSWDGTPDYDLPGFYFSESTDESGSYGDNVKKYYIKIQKPYEGSLYRLAKEKGSYRKAYEYLIAEGYDGYIDTEMGEGYTEYIVLKPENIKSATNNIGTFDKTNPDTRYSLPMYPTLPDAAEVEVELNERDWGFDWSDEALRKKAQPFPIITLAK